MIIGCGRRRNNDCRRLVISSRTDVFLFRPKSSRRRRRCRRAIARHIYGTDAHVGIIITYDDTMILKHKKNAWTISRVVCARARAFVCVCIVCGAFVLFTFFKSVKIIYEWHSTRPIVTRNLKCARRLLLYSIWQLSLYNAAHIRNAHGRYARVSKPRVFSSHADHTNITPRL